MRARIGDFSRFAVPYKRQSRKKLSANNLIIAYNGQLHVNELLADMTFFRYNLITVRMLATASVDDALAEIGKGRLATKD